MKRAIVLLSVALLLVSAAAFGQAQRGSITVSVTDSDGAVLPGALVSAVSEDTLTRRTVPTDAGGEAELVGLHPATNYVVTVTLDGFAGARIPDLVVRAGVNTDIGVQLTLAEVSEELIVTAESPLVDVRKTQAGQDITLELAEALPTARGFTDYLQLVPGVQDTIGVDGEDSPASRSGVNYRDAHRLGGDVTFSTDNLYYFDGINVTDRETGVSSATINNEVIQEQSVITGAIPAEFIGAPGLVSNVVTKSGGNSFSGSVNYYFQNDSLVEDNEHFPDDTFSSWDAAATLGGPIWRDKAWFFASYREGELERDVVDEQGTYLRTPTLDTEQIFAKVTWAITDSDVFTGLYMDDPRTQSGLFEREVPNDADEIRERGGERWGVTYNRVWGSAALELGATDHDGDRSEFAVNRANRNTISFQPDQDFTSAEELLGGAGQDFENIRSTDSIRGSLEWLLDSSWGDHSLKFGVVDGSSDLFENQLLTGDPPATFISLDPRGTDGNVQLCEIIGLCGDPWSTGDFGISSDEVNGFNENISGAQRDALIGKGWDENGDGFFDQNELANNMFYGSTAGNPQGKINYTRDLMVQEGPSNKGSEFTHYYVQDSWQWNKWSINAGIRAEDHTFIADTGVDVGTFDVEYAPRVSISYDLKGDGRSSVGLFYGEYYDAYRDNAIDFAGSLSGRIINEQVYVDELGDWVTFRVRGGPSVQDAFFAPKIETPVTEELQLQYKRDLGRNMMFEINLIDRETTGIGEDYGTLYYDIDDYIGLGGNPNAPDSLFLGPEFFGFAGLASIPTNLNFLIGTLPPGNYRDWQGAELVFRKRYSDNWQMLASYNYADADGNSNSDANFDGAGDVIFLDPRAPNRTGVQPGLVEHLFKVAASYSWDNGFQAGGSYRWNSGITLNRNDSQSFGRSLPDRLAAEDSFPSNGWPGGTFEDNWLEGDALGFIDGEAYGVLDLRGSYLLGIGERVEVDFFLDIFNVLDEQDVIRLQDLLPGGDGFAYLEGVNFVDPRRYYLGARVRF